MSSQNATPNSFDATVTGSRKAAIRLRVTRSSAPAWIASVNGGAIFFRAVLSRCSVRINSCAALTKSAIAWRCGAL